MNILLLEKGCQKCAYVKVALDMDKVEDNTFLGKNGEKIYLFFSANSDCTELFAQQFGMTGVAPILKKDDGSEITDINEIIKFFRVSGYIKG